MHRYVLISETADEPNFLQAPIHLMIGYDNLVIGDDWSPKGDVS